MATYKISFNLENQQFPLTDGFRVVVINYNISPHFGDISNGLFTFKYSDLTSIYHVVKNGEISIDTRQSLYQQALLEIEMRMKDGFLIDKDEVTFDSTFPPIDCHKIDLSNSNEFFLDIEV